MDNISLTRTKMQEHMEQRRYSILLVEKDKLIRDSLKRLLTAKSHNVDIASDYDEAFSFIYPDNPNYISPPDHVNIYDLVVLDYSIDVKKIEYFNSLIQNTIDAPTLITGFSLSNKVIDSMRRKSFIGVFDKNRGVDELVKEIEWDLMTKTKPMGAILGENHCLVAIKDPFKRKTYSDLLEKKGVKTIQSYDVLSTLDQLLKAGWIKDCNICAAIIDRDLPSNLSIKDSNIHPINLMKKIKTAYPYMNISMIAETMDPKDYHEFRGDELYQYASFRDNTDQVTNSVIDSIDLFSRRAKTAINEGYRNIFMVVGHGGVGKSTLCLNLNIALPYTYTPTRDVTRDKRKGEHDGKDHTFVSLDEFKSKEYDYRYSLPGYEVGFPKGSIKDSLRAGKDVLMIVKSIDAAIEIKEMYPHSIMIGVMSKMKRGGKKSSNDISLLKNQNFRENFLNYETIYTADPMFEKGIERRLERLLQIREGILDASRIINESRYKVAKPSWHF